MFYKKIPIVWMFYFLHNNNSADSTRAAMKVMPPNLLHWPKLTKADAGGMAAEAECPTNMPLCFGTK